MIDLQSVYLSAVLEGVETRAEIAAEVVDWADGTADLRPAELAPPIAYQHQSKAFERFARQVQSLGPRAIAHKLTSAIGSVNWGGDDPGSIDDRLASLDLERLARGALKQLASVGIAGLHPNQPEVGVPRIQRMAGYLEPLYAEDDVGGEPAAWFQAMSEADGKSWRLRVYAPDPDDPLRGTLQEWRHAERAFEIGHAPTSVWENVMMPAVVMVDVDQSGLPIGELAQALPLLKGEVAQQIRILRASDANAWPTRWMTGDWDIPDNVGAEDVLVANDPSSTIGLIEPPALAGPFEQHDRVMERIRGDLKLPISSISTGNFPSGEALEQANAISIATATMYAALLSRLLSTAVMGFSELLGIAAKDAPPVAVEVNREQTRRMVAEQARNDWRDGLVSFRAAVLTISQYYPIWGDDDIEAFITDGEGVIPDEPLQPEAAEVPEP